MSSISSNSSRGIVSSNSSQTAQLQLLQQPAATAQPNREKYRTCCDCCHIKTGTVFLGVLEAVVLAAALYGIAQQLVWKSATYTRGACNSNILRDCLLLDFSHFSLTLIFDYIIALLLVVVLFSILLMFCGIFSDTSCLLFPHLFVQAIFLLFSVGYFILYAWSYFYGDLYTHKRSFEMQSFVERMWLASVLLILASFQVYLFFAVFKCSLYLAKVDYSRRERETAFERLSERVRLAKENGLWRQSGVGGFMSYTRQEEDERRKREKRQKGLVGHVQWSNENKVVLLDEDPSRSEALPAAAPPQQAPPLYRPTVQFVQQPQLHLQQQQRPPAAVLPMALSDPPSERRRSNDTTTDNKETSPSKGRTPSISQATQGGAIPTRTSSQKERERHSMSQNVKRSESAQHPQQQQQPKTSHERQQRPRGDSSVKIPLDDEYIPATPPSPIRRKSSREEKLREASHAAILFDKARREREREMKEAEKTRTSSSSSPEKDFKEPRASISKAGKKSEKEKKDKSYLNPEAAGTSAQDRHASSSSPSHHHHHHHHSHSGPSTSHGETTYKDERRESGIEDTAEGRRRGPRALRKLRSVESGEYDVPEEVFERRMKSRRRSSDAGRAAGAAERVAHKHHSKQKERERDSGNPPSPSERKPYDAAVIVKKISITATTSPFA